jgi:hypothetical protein
MSKDLHDLLCLACCLIAGIVSAEAIRKFRPQWFRSSKKVLDHPKMWFVVPLGFLFCGWLAYSCYSKGDIVLATWLALFSLAALVETIWATLKNTPPGGQR